MKVTIYTIPDCPFCKQEREYLTAKGLTFDDKNVQENRDALAEMLQLSNNFAGVPFTVIEKDGGEKVMLKGFTQGEFDEALTGSTAKASAAAPAAQPAATASTAQQSTIAAPTTPSVSAPTIPSTPTPTAPPIPAPKPAPVTPQTTATPSSTGSNDIDPQSALNDLLAGAGMSGATPSMPPVTLSPQQAPAPKAPTMAATTPSVSAVPTVTPSPSMPKAPAAPSFPMQQQPASQKVATAPTMGSASPSIQTPPTAPAANQLQPELPDLPDFGKAN